MAFAYATPSTSPVEVSGSFVGVDGTHFPSNIYKNSPGFLESIGIYEIVEPVTPEGKRVVSSSLAFVENEVRRIAVFEDIPPPQPPDDIHIAWLRAALAEANKLDAVNNAVASQGQVKQALWDYATTISRADPDVVAIASALSIDLAALFLRADEIRRSRGL